MKTIGKNEKGEPKSGIVAFANVELALLCGLVLKELYGIEVMSNASYGVQARPDSNLRSSAPEWHTFKYTKQSFSWEGKKFDTGMRKISTLSELYYFVDSLGKNEKRIKLSNGEALLTGDKATINGTTLSMEELDAILEGLKTLA